MVAEHNDVVEYVEEIREQGSFELGSSSTGQHAHLASFENTSAWNNRRDRNVAEYAPHVHNASLQVVRNASADPLKYLMKYFSIKADQNTLADVQRVANDISRLEEAVANVKKTRSGHHREDQPACVSSSSTTARSSGTRSALTCRLSRCLTRSTSSSTPLQVATAVRSQPSSSTLQRLRRCLRRWSTRSAGPTRLPGSAR